ncbi:MAG: hypothetical protein QUS14_12510 [Pyrinomonadaceae bacterium]|nr:hypothetical protein [Pyrinomonadaceae bacterium]
MNRTTRLDRIVLLSAILLALTGLTFAQSGGNFSITKSVIAGGGGSASGGNFSVNGTIGQAVAGGPSTGGSFSLQSGFWSGGSSPVTQNIALFDFDGDGKSDLSTFKPGPGEWWYLRSSDGGNRAFQFGLGTDVLVPADYTGDGKTDNAFYRNGEWFIQRSSDFSFYSFPFGTATDVPAPGDYDGDGKADAAVFRPSTGVWFVQRSSDGGVIVEAFGANGDRPVPADYDGDGIDDFAIHRPGGQSGAEWWLKRSSLGVIAATFGLPTDKTVQGGDYTGDGKADVAFFRNGTWFVLRTSDFSFYSFPFGATGDIPAPGDYDGDGTTDAAVFRPSDTNWYVQRSTAGVLIQQFGAATDRPVPNAYVR